MTPALSFGLPLVFVPLMIVAWMYGGWTILAVPIFGYVIITIFDFFIGTKLIAPKINPDNDNKKYKSCHFVKLRVNNRHEESRSGMECLICSK